MDKYGICVPNYHYEDLMRLWELYGKRELENPAAIVDANHSNSNKSTGEQIRIVSEVLHSRNYNPEVKRPCQGRDDRELSGKRATRRSTAGGCMENPSQTPAGLEGYGKAAPFHSGKMLSGGDKGNSWKRIRGHYGIIEDKTEPVITARQICQ